MIRAALDNLAARDALARCATCGRWVLLPRMAYLADLDLIDQVVCGPCNTDPLWNTL